MKTAAGTQPGLRQCKEGDISKVFPCSLQVLFCDVSFSIHGENQHMHCILETLKILLDTCSGTGQKAAAGPSVSQGASSIGNVRAQRAADRAHNEAVIGSTDEHVAQALADEEAQVKLQLCSLSVSSSEQYQQQQKHVGWESALVISVRLLENIYFRKHQPQMCTTTRIQSKMMNIRVQMLAVDVQQGSPALCLQQ